MLIEIEARGTVEPSDDDIERWKKMAKDAGVSLRQFLDEEIHLIWNDIDWDVTDVWPRS